MVSCAGTLSKTRSILANYHKANFRNPRVLCQPLSWKLESSTASLFRCRRNPDNHLLESSMACASGEGFAGAINFHPSSESPAVDLTGRVHLLPCSIKQDGPCSVSHYFKPRKTDAMVDDLCVKEAFFRGRKLEGVTIPLPQGYRGYVLDKKRSVNENCSGTTGGGFDRWVSRAEFASLTYWNHDNLPSSDDLLPRCFHWFPVANATDQSQRKDRITVFNDTHYSSAKGWIGETTKTTYADMMRLHDEYVQTQDITGDDIDTIHIADRVCDKVLGTRSGYIKGLGSRPKQ